MPVALAAHLGGCDAAPPPSHATLWLHRLTGIEQAEARGLAVSGAGDLVVLAEFRGVVTLGAEVVHNECTTGSFRRDLLLVALDAAGAPRWHRAFPCAEGSVIAADPAGGVVVAGAMRTPIDFGDGLRKPGSDGRDVFVVKLDGAGKTLWSRMFTAENDQRASGIAVGPAGDIVVVGGFQGSVDFGAGPMAGLFDQRMNLFVLDLDASGRHVWSKGIPADLWQGPTVAVDPAGNVVVAASLRSSHANLGGGPVGGDGGILVARIDPGGAHLWSRAFGERSDAVHAVATDAQGDLVLAGETSGAIDFGAGPIGEGSDDSPDPFVVKLDRAGEPLWARRFGVKTYGFLSGSAQATSLVVGPAGDVFVAGKVLGGTVDLGGGPLSDEAGNFIGKLDAAGHHVWSTHISKREKRDPSHHRLALDAAGQLAVTADVTSRPSSGDPVYGLFIAKLTP